MVITMKIKTCITVLCALCSISAVHSQSAQPIERVDMGLSVDWATVNLGASQPEEAGGYFGWADPTGTETSTDVFDNNRNWVSDLYGGVNPLSDICGTDLDIVHLRLGEGWRMPSLDELNELLSCPRRWIKQNGVNGYEFTGKNGNVIFIPAAGARNGENMNYVGAVGYYWTGTLGADPTLHNQRAHRLYMGAEGVNSHPAIRYSGFQIRPVWDKNYSGIYEVHTDSIPTDSAIYDLTGRKLNTIPQKGFYICKGKKYIAK